MLNPSIDQIVRSHDARSHPPPSTVWGDLPINADRLTPSLAISSNPILLPATLLLTAVLHRFSWPACKLMADRLGNRDEMTVLCTSEAYPADSASLVGWVCLVGSCRRAPPSHNTHMIIFPHYHWYIKWVGEKYQIHKKSGAMPKLVPVLSNSFVLGCL